MGRETLTVRLGGLSALPRSARKPTLISAAVKRAFALEKSRRAGEVAVIFVSRVEMRNLNRQYLGHDYDTDVVTFEHEGCPGVPLEETPIGDIFISSWMARRQARELGHAVLTEVLTLCAHGALHLLGHEDHSPRKKARMFKVQDRVLAGLSS